MRAYSAADEEALRARKLLKDWRGEGFLTDAQYQGMEQETVSNLKRTNVFLRVVLFLFTQLIVGAATRLFLMVFLSRPSPYGGILLLFAAVSYGAAEYATAKGRFYRHGIEESLLTCSVGFFCAGLQSLLPKPTGVEFLVPAAGAALSLWIWYRFGLAYAFVAAMVFVVFLPGHWTLSHAAQRVMIALVYCAGLAGVAAVRSRHRFDYLDDGYALVEGFLWLGVYLAINLKFLSWNLFEMWQVGGGRNGEFSGPFYWTSWVLIWCLPPAVLARGISRKDRAVIAVGVIIALLTFLTSKPYLGWERHTWDPMVLGVVLMSAVLLIRRWLAAAPGGIRRGFTAERLSNKDRSWLNSRAGVFGMLSPHAAGAAPPAESADVHFGGGDSGGGGATGDF